MTEPTYIRHAQTRIRELEQIKTAPPQREKWQEPPIFEPFSLFFEQAPYPIWIFDVDTLTFLAVNDAALTHYGYSRQEWFSMTAKDLFASHEIPRLLESMAVQERSGKLDFQGVWIHQKKDGSLIDADVTTFFTLFEGHRSLAVIVHDITERRKAQEERERLLQERVEAQEEAARRMDEFLGIASHELKTPLTIIAGMIDVLMMTLQQAQEGTPPAQEQRVLPITDTLFTLLTNAQQEADLLVRLVSDLLDISRAQSAQLVMQKRRCDLAEIVRTTVQRQRHLAPTRHLRLNIVGADHMLVYADADRLEQVLANYISNAFKYTHVDRPVDVELRQTGQQGCVLVRDYGEGLAPEECQRVWERFYRGVGGPGKADTAGGLGLGLYISRSIIERHQGQVGVESIPGEGATFWFSVPLASEQEQL